MSKQMDRATMAAYQRARRAKKKAAALAAVNPAVKPDAAPCQNCVRLEAENARLLKRIATLDACHEECARRPGPESRDAAEALRQRVLADKINSYGKNPVIGRARI